MCFHSACTCARFRLCQIATSAISGNTPVPGGLSVTSAVSQWRGETLQTPSLRNTDIWYESLRPVCGNAPYKSYMTSTTRHQLCINNKHASVIFTSIQRMYVSMSFLSHSPALPPSPLKAPAALNSMCHRKRQTGRDRLDTHKKKDTRVRGWRMDKPDDNDRITTFGV